MTSVVRFCPIFEVVTATDPKIEALSVIQSTPNFVIVSKLNLKPGKMGEKSFAVLGLKWQICLHPAPKKVNSKTFGLLFAYQDLTMFSPARKNLFSCVSSFMGDILNRDFSEFVFLTNYRSQELMAVEERLKVHMKQSTGMKGTVNNPFIDIQVTFTVSPILLR